jgi:LuxR family maltose regulon positive regulatory protein
MHVALAEIGCERGDQRAVARHLEQSQELGEHNGLPQHRFRWRVATARLRQAQGDLAGALDLLSEAERHYVSDFFPNVRPIGAMKARVLIAQGQLAQARGWALEQGLSAADELSYLREFEHVTLARLLVAERTKGSLRDATRLLDRLLTAAEPGGRTGRVIEMLALRSQAHQALGDKAAAEADRERAMRLAEPEGFIPAFADEGGPMAAPAVPGLAGQGLADPMSERELEVLRLLASELDGPEIARQLSVSLNTLRTHTKHIYTKLGVTSRRAAVRRAAELGLPRPASHQR